MSSGSSSSDSSSSLAMPLVNGEAQSARVQQNFQSNTDGAEGSKESMIAAIAWQHKILLKPSTNFVEKRWSLRSSGADVKRTLIGSR